MGNDILAPAAIAERRRIHEALRRIAARYRDGECGQIADHSQTSELAIRRAIEEIFEAPIPWRPEDALHVERKATLRNE